MRDHATEAAHGGAKIDSVERILSMPRSEVDDLPYGFVVLDEEGAILLYNRYESRMARLPPEHVLGRNFFLDVAPCTRVEAFHGRFRKMVADPSILAERFAFRFHFLHGAQDVTVDLLRVPEGAAAAGSSLAGARVFMVVERRMVAGAASSSRNALALDADTGCAEGPLGPVLPIPAGLLGDVLRKLDPEDAREVGRRLGAGIAEAASLDAESHGEADLAAAPAQLAAGALDDALARAGLGRIALDQTAREGSGVIGCLLRPAPGLPARALATLYEGLVEAALGAALGRTLRARCLDTDTLFAQPWRFALAGPDLAGELDPRPGERADAVARRLGLLVDDVT